MSKLMDEKCEACRVDAPQVTDEEAHELFREIPDWEITSEDNELRLKRVFIFETFEDALAFTNRVGALAEEQNHHPALLTEWGKVTVQWWTHKIHGLHKNDFIMAAKTDRLV